MLYVPAQNLSLWGNHISLPLDPLLNQCGICGTGNSQVSQFEVLLDSRAPTVLLNVVLEFPDYQKCTSNFELIKLLDVSVL